MDQALKQRLVGATVLIALGVIFLPIFIGGGDDEQLSSQNDEFLIPPQPQIARQSNGIQEQPGRRLPLVPPAPVTESRGNVDSTVNLSSGDIRLPLPEEQLPPESTQGAASSVVEGIPITSETLPVDNPAPTIETALQNVASSVQNEPTITPPISTPEPTLDDLIEPFVTEPATATNQVDLSNDWRVQVASLGNPDNAARLTEQLRSLGYSAQRESITTNSGVNLHRVSAGPFTNASAAEAAASAIRSNDSRLNPQVLRPLNSAPNAEPVSNQASSTTPTGLDRYAVQTGVFSSGENANKLVENLTNAGYAAYSERVDSNGSSMFRVRIGPLLSNEDADNIATRIQRDLNIKGIVVDYPR